MTHKNYSRINIKRQEKLKAECQLLKIKREEFNTWSKQQQQMHENLVLSIGLEV
jgi:hypothetical protein